MTVDLSSFPLEPWPERLSQEFMSKFEQDLVVKTAEWQTIKRMNCEIYIRESSSDTWKYRSKISILNRDGSPYTHPNFGAALNPNAQGYISLNGTQELAVKLVDCGSGLLRGEDKLSISGQITELCFVRDDSVFITETQNILKSIPPSGIKIAQLPRNTAWFTYRNNGTKRIWINYGRLNGIGYGEALEPGEATTIKNEPFNSYRWYGEIWAIAEGENSQPLSGILAIA